MDRHDVHVHPRWSPRRTRPVSRSTRNCALDRPITSSSAGPAPVAGIPRRAALTSSGVVVDSAHPDPGAGSRVAGADEHRDLVLLGPHRRADDLGHFGTGHLDGPLAGGHGVRRIPVRCDRADAKVGVAPHGHPPAARLGFHLWPYLLLEVVGGLPSRAGSPASVYIRTCMVLTPEPRQVHASGQSNTRVIGGQEPGRGAGGYRGAMARAQGDPRGGRPRGGRLQPGQGLLPADRAHQAGPGPVLPERGRRCAARGDAAGRWC